MNVFDIRGSRRSKLTEQDRLLMQRVAELRQCMLCGAHGAVEVSHSDQITDGKAFGMKSHPYALAALCDQCHRENGHGRTNKAEAFADWNMAHKRTMMTLYTQVKIEVK